MKPFCQRKFWFCLLPVLSFCFAAPAAESFRFGEKRVNLPEVGEVTSCALMKGAEEYMFLPPRDWRMKFAPGQAQLTLESPNHEASITFDVLAAGSTKAPDSSSTIFRQEVFRQFTNANIREEFPCYSGANPGQGFEVDWLAFDKYQMGARIVFIPISGGTLKLVLNASIPSLPLYQPVFGRLLTSFHQTSAEAK